MWLRRELEPDRYLVGLHQDLCKGVLHRRAHTELHEGQQPLDGLDQRRRAHAPAGLTEAGGDA